MSGLVSRRPLVLSRPMILLASTLLATYIAFLVFPGTNWKTSGVAVWDWPGVTTILSGTLIAAAATWWAQTVARLLGSGTWHRRHPVRLAALTVAPIATVVVVVHLAATGLTVVVGRLGAVPVGLLGSELVVEQVAAVILFAAVGTAVGLCVRHRLAAPLVGVALFLAPIAGFSRLPSELFLIGGATGIPLGYGPSRALVALHTGWALGLGLAALCGGLWSAGIRRPTTAAGVLLGAAVAVPSGVLLAADPPDRFEPRVQVALRCDQRTASLCLPADLEPLRDAYRRALDAELAVLARLPLPPAPQRFEVTSSTARPDADVRSLPPPGTTSTTAQDLIDSIDFGLAVSGTKTCLDAGSIPAGQGESVLNAVRWLQAEAGSVGAEVDPAVVLLRVRGDEGLQWLAAVFRAYGECDPAGIPAPLQ